MNWYVHHEGETVGPLDAYEVRRRFLRAVPVQLCPEGGETWHASNDLTELSALLCRTAVGERLIPTEDLPREVAGGRVRSEDPLLVLDAWTTVGEHLERIKARETPVTASRAAAAANLGRRLDKVRTTVALVGVLVVILGGVLYALRAPSGAPAESAPVAAEIAPAPAPPETIRLTLPDDWARLQEQFGARIVRWNARALALVIASPPRDSSMLLIHLPAGMTFKPREGAPPGFITEVGSEVILVGVGSNAPIQSVKKFHYDLSPFFSCRAETLVVEGGDGERQYPFLAVDWDEKGMDRPENRLSVRFDPAPPDAASDKIVAFLRAAARTGASWNACRVGVSLLTGGLELDALAAKQARAEERLPDVEWGTSWSDGDWTYRGAQPAPRFVLKETARLADYRIIAEAEDAFAAMGDTSRQAFFTEMRERTKRLLAAVDLRTVDEKFLAKASFHRGSPELERALIRIRKEHSVRTLREEAVKLLAEGAIAGNRDELLAKALAATDPEHSFWSAVTLLRAYDDPRSYPLLAAYEATPAAGYARAPLIQRLTARTGEAPQPGEGLTEYWKRVYGWERLAAAGGDLAMIEATAEMIRMRRDFEIDLGAEAGTRSQTAAEVRALQATSAVELQTMRLASPPLETLEVPNRRGATPTTRLRTEVGAQYIIEISGTVSNDPERRKIQDALWNWTPPRRPARPRPGVKPPEPRRFKESYLLINDQSIAHYAKTYLEFNPRNVYRIPFVGDGAPIRFHTYGSIVYKAEILSGSFRVKIYRRDG